MPERGVVGSRGAVWSEAAADLAALAAEVAPELSAAAAEVAARLEAGRFHISVVGEFKRGKSTLVNALLGRELLPTGVLPLTAVPVEVAYGPEGAVVEHGDGRRVTIAVDELAVFATEEHNPGNHRDVARVRVTLPVRLLASGAVLVDTPGLGSTHAHSTQAAQRAVDATDGAVVVFSADAPFSQRERELLDVVRRRSARTFFVLNRADHLDDAGLAQVREFVTATLRDALAHDVDVYAMSARRALHACTDGATPDTGFDAFARDLQRFIADDLASARAAAAVRDLRGLADRIDAAVELEAAALELTAGELDEGLARFAGEAARQRQAFAEDRLLLRHAVDAIAGRLGEQLQSAAVQEPPPDAAARLVEAVAATPPGRIDVALDDAVADLVHARFEQLRPALAGQVENAWRQAAGHFRVRWRRGSRRCGRPPRICSTVSCRRCRCRPLRRCRRSSPTSSSACLIPVRASRGWCGGCCRVGGCARGWCGARSGGWPTSSTNAGRVRYDLVRRLHAARDAFVGVLAGYLDEWIVGVTAAAERAQVRRGVVGARLDAERLRVAVVRRRTAAARRAAEAG